MSTVSSTSSLAASLSSLVTQYQSSLVSKQVVPVQTKQAALTSRLSALNTLKATLSALNTSATALTKTDSTSPFSVYSVSDSNTTVLTATASPSVTTGNHTILVSQLAKPDTIVSSRFSSTATSIVSNELTPDEQTAGTADRQVKIVVGGQEEATVDVTLNYSPSADTNGSVLSKIADAINASSSAKQYVTASVVAITPTESRLVLTGVGTGSGNAISLADGGTGTLLESIGLGGNVFVERTAASTASTPDDPVTNPGGYLISGDVTNLDAKINVDGIDIERQSNTITDVLSGITLQLRSAQGVDDTPVSISIGLARSQIESTIQQFLNSYNQAISYINAQTAIDPKTGSLQIFSLDTFVKGIRSSLRSMVMNPISGLASGLNMLSDFGITAASDGTLSITDGTALDTALTVNPKSVSGLFNSSQGLAVQLKSYLDPYTKAGGQFDTQADGVNQQITSLSTRITNLNAQIDKQVQAYKDEFAQLESVYTEANQQLQMVYQILGISTSILG
jgi:flagellar hook-associated protein 2